MDHLISISGPHKAEARLLPRTELDAEFREGGFFQKPGQLHSLVPLDSLSIDELNAA